MKRQKMTEESNNVVSFRVVTNSTSTPDVTLSEALKQLKEVLVIGTTIDGIPYISTSCTENKDVLWLLETAKHALMESIFFGDEDEL